MIDDGGRMAECANVSFFVPYTYNNRGITGGTYSICVTVLVFTVYMHCNLPLIIKGHTLDSGDNYKASHILFCY